MTNALTEQTVTEYIKSLPALAQVFGSATDLVAQPVTEGNVNINFRVHSQSDPSKSVFIKQALPHSWRYPDFKMPVDRSRIEYEMLTLEGKYCPGLTPKVYSYDAERAIQVLEDLNQHLVMREGLMQQVCYPRVAEHIGTFMARTLFFTSDLYLPSAEKKAMVARFMNPVLCKVQEDLVFTQPYMEHPNNRWTRLLDPQVEAIRSNDALRAEVFVMKEAYLTHAQALLHNDLHTGSVMVNQQETKVIDPEFAFYGPSGHDIGSYLANLVIGYGAQEWHCPDPAKRAEYRRWLLDTLRATWQVFAAEFLRLWDEQGNAEWPSSAFRQRYMRQLLQDTAGFGATEIMRRTIGMAHVHDFWTITDDAVRATAESIALNVAVEWLMKRQSFTSIDDLVDIVATAKSSYPF